MEKIAGKRRDYNSRITESLYIGAVLALVVLVEHSRQKEVPVRYERRPDGRRPDFILGTQPQQGSPQHAPMAQHAAANAVGLAAYADPAVSDAAKAINRVTYFIIILQKIEIQISYTVRGGGASGLLEMERMASVAASGAEELSISSEIRTACGMIAAAQMRAQSPAVVGQADGA